MSMLKRPGHAQEKNAGSRAARALKVFTLLITALSLVSCQAAGIGTIKVEPRKLQSLKEFEEYTGYALESSDFDVETLLMLTEEYFRETEEVLKETSGPDWDGGAGASVTDHSALIKGLRAIIEEFPDKRGMAPFHYTLGYALQDEGRTDEAMAVFKDFIERYGAAPQAQEVSFRLAEMYFDTGQLGEARNAFILILEGPESIFHEKVLYKLGWTHFKLDEFEEAIAYFSHLAETAPAGNLKNESFKNILLSLAHMNDADRERTTRELAVKQDGPAFILELGRLFTEQTRFQEAINTYSLFKDTFPDNPALPEAYIETATAYERLKKASEATGEREELVERFNPAAPWYVKNHPEGNAAVDALVKETLLKLAVNYQGGTRLPHPDGGDGGRLEMAVKAYKRYLSYFPDSEDSPGARLLVAEAYFEGENYAEAARSYEELIWIFRGLAEGEDAAFAALISHELMTADAGPDESDEAAWAVIRITESFKTHFPESPRLKELTHRAADQLVRMERYQGARGVLLVLAEGKLDGEKDAEAYKKIGDIFLTEKDLDGAVRAYTTSLDISEDPEIRTKLSQLHYVIAADNRKVGRPEKAAEHYFKVFSNLKGSELGENSLASVGRIYLERGDMERLKEVVKMIETNYPESTAAASLTVEAARTVEKKGRIVEAAGLYEDAARLVGDKLDSRKLILKAARILDGAGEYRTVEKMLEKHMRTGAVAGQSRTEALYLLASARLHTGKHAKGMKTLELIASEKTGAGGEFYAAKAKLLLADVKVREFSKMKIVQPFTKSLKKKEELLAELLDDLTFVIKNAPAELLPETFYYMGTVLEDFKNSLIDSERPGELTSEELVEYVFQLEEKAYPFEEKAVRAYSNGLRASMKLKSAGKDFAPALKAVRRLSELRPALFRRELYMGKKILFAEPEPVREPVASM